MNLWMLLSRYQWMQLNQCLHCFLSVFCPDGAGPKRAMLCEGALGVVHWRVLGGRASALRSMAHTGISGAFNWLFFLVGHCDDRRNEATSASDEGDELLRKIHRIIPRHVVVYVFIEPRRALPNPIPCPVRKPLKCPHQQ